MNFEPEIQFYTGKPSWEESGKHHHISGLTETCKIMWPDLDIPADIIILPAEDYEIILEDLKGQRYTPRRRPISVRAYRESLGWFRKRSFLHGVVYKSIIIFLCAEGLLSIIHSILINIFVK